jgi:hypothetical protein
LERHLVERKPELHGVTAMKAHSHENLKSGILMKLVAAVKTLESDISMSLQFNFLVQFSE